MAAISLFYFFFDMPTKVAFHSHEEVKKEPKFYSTANSSELFLDFRDGNFLYVPLSYGTAFLTIECVRCHAIKDKIKNHAVD